MKADKCWIAVMQQCATKPQWSDSYASKRTERKNPLWNNIAEHTRYPHPSWHPSKMWARALSKNRWDSTRFGWSQKERKKKKKQKTSLKMLYFRTGGRGWSVCSFWYYRNEKDMFGNWVIASMFRCTGH